MRDGKVVEGWGTYDFGTFFQQLGVPPPSPAHVAFFQQHDATLTPPANGTTTA